MSFGKTITLNNGVKLPQIGLGTWQSAPGQVQDAVEAAIKAGYRHIDAAVIYGNQNEVAEGIRRAAVDRKELFLVSKLWCNSHRPELVEADLDNTLKELDTDYLDLYLIHWPTHFAPGKTMSATAAREDGKGQEVVIDTEAPSIAETWKAMVKLLDSGKVKAIGVSNFTIKHLEILAAASDVIPAVNQIEAHPLLQQAELLEYCAKKNIHITAYSPLGQNITGRPPVIAHKTVEEVAKKANATTAQVLIAWGVSKGYSVIPKSVTPSRIASNFQQVTLAQEDLDTISDIVKTEGRMRYNIPMLYDPRWPINVFEEDSEKDAPRKVW
ncbi:NADP-dependent oxidoreductase domain-containing protein [Leucosporidium creatinivorum]|uniref:NADP-dependent oxidoreductase domain-containing protein n=1 Tax=Leucosporidium creatinivorum TaxID=106004 RepID=A0A1Y2G060_9BASI|nr:NADP-dependent oxidoreductase domain-containing protein [Leucosporidium creatinivorum]